MVARELLEFLNESRNFGGEFLGSLGIGWMWWIKVMSKVFNKFQVGMSF